MSTSARKSPIVDAAGGELVAVSSDGKTQYVSQRQWMESGTRSWEGGDTTRLNEAHWSRVVASDRSINDWLSDKLSTVRARVIYESRQNGTITGIVTTLANDVVGPDGPTLDVQSSDERYNKAVERVWRDWFRAPTFRPNVSGTSLLRLWVQDLPIAGEFIAQIATDSAAAGPVKMRLRPKHARDLASPVDGSNAERTILGVEFETAELDRPLRYWLSRRSSNGLASEVRPWPAEQVIHEFAAVEEGQARGFPWLTPSLQAAGDLRDYDDQVQDAARLMADQSCLLFTTDTTEPHMAPEASEFKRRTIRMAPPGWQPFNIGAGQPPVQYPEYRAERLREIGRPMSMPLMIVQQDASDHNYSSARFDGQNYAQFVRWVQNFLGGTPKSIGTLDRLCDIVLTEARFDDPILRNPPPDARRIWTWPGRPHVDPLKEAKGVTERLSSQQTSLIDEQSSQGGSLETHIAKQVRAREVLEAADLPLPDYLSRPSTATAVPETANPFQQGAADGQ